MGSLLPHLIEITARTAAALYCRKKLENLPRTDKQTDTQTDREFNYRGHSYPLWIVGGSGPITARTSVSLYCRKKLENLPRTSRQTDKQTNTQTENSITEATLIPCGSSGGAGQYKWQEPVLVTHRKITKITLRPLIRMSN